MNFFSVKSAHLGLFILVGFLMINLPLAQAAPDTNISYTNAVKPILISRCAACHACYDAPCQLKLTSSEGLLRGSTKQPVYDHYRLSAAAPTRLFIDASSTAVWRDKGFFSVLNDGDSADNTLLAKFLQLKRQHPLPISGKLPNSMPLAIDRELQCPKPEEFDKHAKAHPLWGMPYAMPPLTDKEEATLLTWLKQGAVIDTPVAQRHDAADVAKWEQFLNGTSLKQQLMARYLYEHLYIGDLHLQGQPLGEFYKLVRSTTPPSMTIDEIPSVRPFDNPKVQFYYRLRPFTETIVDKNHFVYELSDSKLQRFNELFLQPNYTVTRLPDYDANPFKTFAELPVVSRYSFLLDDAQYFFSGFIKGPVCMGQAAVNVIRDQFWVAFVKPQAEFDTQLTDFFAENSQYLQMPASKGESIGVNDWFAFYSRQAQYVKNKNALMDAVLLKSQAVDLTWLWHGEQHNPNALLTVFRHYDNATVVTGLVGKEPLTAWLVDYSIFERIHYLLVAGFNVFGTAGHQTTTRLYMDFLRMEAENNFLQLLPTAQQKPLHDSWYQGIDVKIAHYVNPPAIPTTHKDSAIRYSSNHYIDELFTQFKAELGEAKGQADLINHDKQNKLNAIDEQIRQLADLQGKEIAALPEVSFLRVRVGVDSRHDKVYSLIRNKKLLNVSFIFAEELRRQPELDTLTVVPDFLGSYPNQFFVVDEKHIPDFIAQLKHAQSTSDLDAFYSRYAIRRTNAAIWQHYDWFTEKYLREQPATAGLFDLNRYENL